MHDPLIRRLASNGKVKSAATRGPGFSWPGSGPQAGVFSGFQYPTPPLTVGDRRRRDAVDKVASPQFDRRGNRIWRDAKKLLDSEAARRAIGEVAVPYGTCSEPSNVQAGGNGCPYRFRCAGCGHFRTDVSYLPDLRAYLDDLLRNRERVLAAADIDQWARAEAVPSSQEITTIRSLIARIEAGLEDLTAAEREQTDQAVAIVRRHRTVTLGTPRMRQALPGIRPGRTA
jgi:hypothetical protein